MKVRRSAYHSPLLGLLVEMLGQQHSHSARKTGPRPEGTAMMETITNRGLMTLLTLCTLPV